MLAARGAREGGGRDFNGWYMGTRCYRTAESMAVELASFGFRVVCQEAGHFPGAGNFVAVLDGDEAPALQ